MTGARKRQVVFVISFLATLILALWAESGLQPWLRKINITGFYLADSLPNFYAVVLLSFCTMAIFAYRENDDIFKTCWKLTVGTLLYEFLQLTMPERTFDPKDLVASILGGVFSYLALTFINKQMSSLIEKGESLPRHTFIRYEKTPDASTNN